MAEIGTLGDIVFSVSRDTVKTFDDFQRKVSGRWEYHEPIQSNVRPEFLGPGQGEISFKIQLSSSLGINPKNEMEKMEKIIEEGSRAPLIIGGKPIGKGDWLIENCDETFKGIDGEGFINYIEATLNLKEYF